MKALSLSDCSYMYVLRLSINVALAEWYNGIMNIIEPHSTEQLGCYGGHIEFDIPNFLYVKYLSRMHLWEWLIQIVNFCLGLNFYWETEICWERGRDNKEDGYQWGWKECQCEQDSHGTEVDGERQCKAGARDWESNVYGSWKEPGRCCILPVKTLCFLFHVGVFQSISWKWINILALSLSASWKKLKQTSWSLLPSFSSWNSLKPLLIIQKFSSGTRF